MASTRNPRTKFAITLACGLVGVATLLGGCSTTRPLPTIRADADHNFRIGQWDRAEADYAEILRRRPDDNEVRYRLGVSQLRAGKPTEAAANLGTALDVDPLNDAIVDAQAEALLAKGDKAALVDFVNRIASERGRVQDYLRVARYTEAVGTPDEAQLALITAAKIDGGRSFDVQWALAQFYQRRGDVQRHIQRLRMAAFLNPENPDLIKAIRDAGQVPGPTFALIPEEMRLAPTGTPATQPTFTAPPPTRPSDGSINPNDGR